MKGSTGGSLGGKVILSHRRRKARERARTRQETEWAARSGPVTTRIDPTVRKPT